MTEASPEQRQVWDESIPPRQAEFPEVVIHDEGARRSLDIAKQYLRERYSENRDARFGLIASSKERDLERLGIPTISRPQCMTEFGAHGLELDAALLACGSEDR